jgi:hypothetical protein
VTAKTHKQRIEKALLMIHPILPSIGKRKQPGMRPQDADAVVAIMQAATKLLEDAKLLYEDAERRHALKKGA